MLSFSPSLRARRRPANRSTARGVALVEVLVAMLIFMVGILGLVGLQTAMTRAQTDSKARADATTLANDLMGRLWTDLNNLAAYDGDACASQTRCSEWQAKVQSALPAGSGAVEVDALSGDVTITIRWALPGGDTHKYVTSTTVAKAST